MAASLQSTMHSVRCIVPVVVTVVALSGCFTFKPLKTAPAPGAKVRVQYTEPRPDLSISTAKHGTVAVPRVRTIAGEVIEVRPDSVKIRVVAVDPHHGKAFRGTTMLPNPADSTSNRKWTQRHYSGGRTLLIVPPLLLLFIAVCYDCGGSSY